MSQTIKLKKGFDIRLVGSAEKKIQEVDQPETFAIKPSDFPGIVQTKMLVKEGDTVKAGTPVFYDKALEAVLYASPVSGEVVEIKRGEKRRVLEVIILADKELEYETHKKYSISDIVSLNKEEASEIMQKGGVWPSIVQRPYGIVADPADTPKSIFISAFDSHPMAPDMAFLLADKEANFQAGLDILTKFTKGAVHLNLDGNAEVAQVFSQATGVQINKISGPHPAGNVGVQIHHLDPINKGEVAWTVDPLSVAQIGKLFLEGIYDSSKLVAITGSEVTNPQYVKTYVGARFDKLLAGNITGTHSRYISGNVLTGEAVGPDGYLGYYHNQISVIPEGDEEEFMGWVMPNNKRTSFHRALGLLSFLSPNKERVLDTNTNGEHRNFVLSGEFEKVTPMDILPTYLFKAIIANDYDEMEALGIYELIEEDIALCEFIDVSKNNVQSLLREGIDLIRNS
ncbi:MAG: Na(+)-translocating NADH-quinone reductase subunit A [Cyclobacteriaceae bacterium]